MKRGENEAKLKLLEYTLYIVYLDIVFRFQLFYIDSFINWAHDLYLRA